MILIENRYKKPMPKTVPIWVREEMDRLRDENEKLRDRLLIPQESNKLKYKFIEAFEAGVKHATEMNIIITSRNITELQNASMFQYLKKIFPK